MSVLEALVALTIAVGVIVAGLETSRLAASQSAFALIDTEAVVRAEALLARAGEDIALMSGRLEGHDGEDVRWTLDIRREDADRTLPAAFVVTADVQIIRAGIESRRSLSTLKLGWEAAR